MNSGTYLCKKQAVASGVLSGSLNLCSPFLLLQALDKENPIPAIKTIIPDVTFDSSTSLF